MPVTDKWLTIGSHEPTLAHCAFRRYLVLWNGSCQEPKPRWERRK